MSSTPIAAVLDEIANQFTDPPPDPTDPSTGHDGVPPVVTDSECRALREVLSQVPDPRHARGVRHRLAPLLAAVVCAVACGARSYTAIAEWVADLTPAQRAELDLSDDRPPPVATTIWRLLIALDPDAVQQMLGTWCRHRLTTPPPPAAPPPAQPPPGRARRVLALDGKTLRGTLHAGRQVHLLAVLDHDSGVVVAQQRVEAKTNEITCFAPVLDQIPDLSGTLVTADAMHAQTAHATYLHGRGAHLLVTVKGNQPSLRSQRRHLPWTDVPRSSRPS